MSVFRAAKSISILTLLSRVLGLARDMAMTNVLGAKAVAGTFNLAWMFPNLLRRLLGEGALSAAFVPAFTKTLDAEGKPAARRLLAHVSGGLLLITGALCLVVILAALFLPPDIWALEGDESIPTAERGPLMWQLTAILIGYSIPICLLAAYAGALNAHGVFAMPAAAPAVLNVIWLLSLGVAAVLTTDSMADVATVVAIGLLVGGCLQLLLGLVPLWRLGAIARPRWPAGHPPTTAVYRAMLPTVLGLSLVQVNILVDQLLTEYLVAPGSNQYIYLANRLLLFPHALVALPLATAVYPRLARLASTETGGVAKTLGHSLRITTFLALPAAVGLMAIADSAVEVLFERGEFTASDSIETRWTTITLVAGLPAIGASQLFARGLYAFDDTRTPARVAGALVVVNLALNLVFVLGVGMGAAGFTTATSICAYLNAITLYRALRARGEAPSVPWVTFALAAIATAVMFGAVVWAQSWFDPTAAIARVLLDLVLPITIGLLVYAATHALLGTDELHELAGRLRRSTRGE